MNVPLDALAFRLVNGRLYGRLLPLISAPNGRRATAGSTP